jgi:hypothetical protein
MSIRKVIDWAIKDQRTDMRGKIVSDFYRQQDNSGNWVWCCDVDLGGNSVNNLRSVPIASNNLDVIYAEQGKGVALSRIGSAKWTITGLSKVITDTIHTITVSFRDDIWEVVGSVMKGDVIRPVTYGELGTLIADSPGYGMLPYGAQAKFDYEGNFIEIMEY